MDILHLSYFIEVARQKSFTKASQTLHVSQPSISKVIKTLENELNVTLFERSGREIALTDVGQAVYNRAQSVVSEFHDLSNEIHDLVNVRYGEITIGLPPMIGSTFFPDIISCFKRLHPQIVLKLIEVGSKQVELDVKNGLLDIGVIALPLTETDIDSYIFVEDKLNIVLPIDHNLADRKTLRLRDISQEDFILYSNDFSLNGLIYRECQKQGFVPKVVCQSSQWDFIVKMVGARLGTALLPDVICQTLDRSAFQTIPLKDTRIPWQLAVIWKKNKYQSFAAREWLRLCQEYFHHAK